MRRGKYALFLMLLFRPFRYIPDALQVWCPVWRPSGGTQGTARGISDTVWLGLYEEFLRWRREDIAALAEPYFRRTTPLEARPGSIDPSAHTSRGARSVPRGGATAEDPQARPRDAALGSRSSSTGDSLASGVVPMSEARVGEPAYDSREWWACMVHEGLRHYDE